MCCPLQSKPKCSIPIFKYRIHLMIRRSWKNSPKTWRNKTYQTSKQCQSPQNVKPNLFDKAWFLPNTQQQRHLELGPTSLKFSPPSTMATKVLAHRGLQYHIKTQNLPWQNVDNKIHNHLYNQSTLFIHHFICKFQHRNPPCFNILQKLITLNFHDFNKLVEFQAHYKAHTKVDI